MSRLLFVEETHYTIAQQFNAVYVMYSRRRVSALCICHHWLTNASLNIERRNLILEVKNVKFTNVVKFRYSAITSGFILTYVSFM
jgi:hypothetical protein